MSGLSHSHNNNVHDWTNIYKKFENLKDDDDDMKEKKKDGDKDSMMNPMAGCNHDHSAERAIWDMTWDDKLKSCRDFREEGNYFFREAQFARAADRYHRALVYFEYCIAETDKEEIEYNNNEMNCERNTGNRLILIRKLRDNKFNEYETIKQKK